MAPAQGRQALIPPESRVFSYPSGNRFSNPDRRFFIAAQKGFEFGGLMRLVSPAFTFLGSRMNIARHRFNRLKVLAAGTAATG